MVTIIVLCAHCGSARLTRNGHAASGKQKYRRSCTSTTETN